MPSPVTHFEILGKDGKKLQGFYSSLFGWEVDTTNPDEYGIVQPQDGRGTGGGIGTNPMGTPSVTFYVEVPDLQAALDKATALGGKIVVPVTEMQGLSFAQFADPEGNVIGIAKSG